MNAFQILYTLIHGLSIKLERQNRKIRDLEDRIKHKGLNYSIGVKRKKK